MSKNQKNNQLKNQRRNSGIKICEAQDLNQPPVMHNYSVLDNEKGKGPMKIAQIDDQTQFDYGNQRKRTLTPSAMKNLAQLEELEVPQYYGMASSSIGKQNTHQENQNDKNTENPPNNSNPTMEDDTEEDFFVYNEEDKKIKNCMIGKFLSEKPLHKLSLNQALSNMWCNPKDLKVTELQQQFLQITMENTDDFKRIIKGSPWILRNSWLVVKEWEGNIKIEDMDFRFVPIWVQLWGLPLQIQTKDMGKKLGARIGRVEESEIYLYPEKARVVKIKVHIDTQKPLKAGIRIGNTVDGISWVDFRYEKLPLFCFQCGLIGHSEDYCKRKGMIEHPNGVNPLGPWLRSNQFGKRIMDPKDRRFSSNPQKSPSYGDISQVPKGLIKALEDLKLANNGGCNKAGAETRNNFENSDQANADQAIPTTGPDLNTLMGITSAPQKRRKVAAECPMKDINEGEAIETQENEEAGLAHKAGLGQ
jgi:hypothetical protein